MFDLGSYLSRAILVDTLSFGDEQDLLMDLVAFKDSKDSYSTMGDLMKSTIALQGA